MRGFKQSNEYVAQFGDLYADTPKAVFAAIALSFATFIGGEEISFNEAVKRVVEEWKILNENGIVPQKAPKEGQ